MLDSKRSNPAMSEFDEMHRDGTPKAPPEPAPLLEGLDVDEEEPERVFLWKFIGSYTRLLKIRGRWYFLGTSAHDLRDWLARHPGVTIIRRGGDAAVNRAWSQHGGATVGALKRAFRPVTESPLP